MHVSWCKKRNMPRVMFFLLYNCFQHAAATVVSKSISASTAKNMQLLSSVIKHLKTLLNYIQKNKRKPTRANNSCMIDWDCNDVQKKKNPHRKKGRFCEVGQSS